jgi:hypothetical protein
VLTPGGGHDIPVAINSPGYRSIDRRLEGVTRVVRPLLPEEPDDMAPRRLPDTWISVTEAPSVPVPVHLVREADQNRVPVFSDRLSERAQIGRVLVVSNGPDADSQRLHLAERDGVVRVRLLSEGGLDRESPGAVIQDDIWPPADGAGEGVHRAVGAWHSVGKDAEERARGRVCVAGTCQAAAADHQRQG